MTRSLLLLVLLGAAACGGDDTTIHGKIAGWTPSFGRRISLYADVAPRVEIDNQPVAADGTFTVSAATALAKAPPGKLGDSWHWPDDGCMHPATSPQAGKMIDLGLELQGGAEPLAARPADPALFELADGELSIVGAYKCSDPQLATQTYDLHLHRGFNFAQFDISTGRLGTLHDATLPAELAIEVIGARR